MTPRAPKTNSPPHRREKKALERRALLVKKLMDENGLSEAEAIIKAQEIMSDNGRKDWRNG